MAKQHAGNPVKPEDEVWTIGLPPVRCAVCGQEEGWLLTRRALDSNGMKYRRFKLHAEGLVCHKGNYWFTMSGGFFYRQPEFFLLLKNRPALVELVRSAVLQNASQLDQTHLRRTQ